MEEKQKNKRYVLRKLFFASLYLSTFTFGGGYVIVTLLKEKFVDQYHWIDEEEMLDLAGFRCSTVFLAFRKVFSNDLENWNPL